MNDTRLYLSKVFLFEHLTNKSRAHSTRKTTKTIEARLIGDLFIHFLNSDLLSLPCDKTTGLSITSDRDTQAFLFENVNGTLYVLNKMSLKKCRKYSSEVNSKCIVVATRDVCTLTIELCTRRFSHDLSSDFVIDRSGDNAIIVPDLSSERLGEIRSNLLSSSIPLPLALLISTPKSVRFTTLHYYHELTTAITLTDKVEEVHRYSPFSVKAGTGSIVELRFSVRMKTAAGDAAIVKVSCIESISYNAYSILKSTSGEELSSSHTGRIATGFFNIPSGTTDVGLLFSTPYGFRGDLNDDPDTDLFSFDLFMLTIT